MKRSTRELVMAGAMLAIALVLPTLFHQFGLSHAVLPMHLPVLLAGLWLGSTYGLLVGLIAPILSTLIFQMPPMAVAWRMMFELAAYGFFAGFFIRIFKKNIAGYYGALILSMIIGRIVYGLVSWIFLTAGGDGYTLQMFIAGTITKSLPGIIIQLVIVPSLAMLLNRQFPINRNVDR